MNTKWIRRKLRTKRPLQDHEEQEPQKQKTSSTADQSEDATQENPATMHREDFLEQIQHAPECLLAVEDGSVSPPASEHTTQMAESRNEDMASELALSSSRNEGMSLLSSQEDMASELTASSSAQAAANGIPVPSVASSEIVAPPELPTEAPRSAGGGVSQTSMNSRPGRDGRLVWQSVFVPCMCEREYGQYTHDPHPGQRDPPTWTYGVADETGGFLLSLLAFACSILLHWTTSQANLCQHHQ